MRHGSTLPDQPEAEPRGGPGKMAPGSAGAPIGARLIGIARVAAALHIAGRTEALARRERSGEGLGKARA